MKKKVPLLLFCLAFICQTSFCMPPGEDHKTLEIGAAAPNFSLKGTDEKMYSLASFKSARLLVVIFTCNHCPTAQAYEDRIIQLVKDYKNKGVAVVAVMPNDPNSVRLDELGYTDISDSFKEMKERAAMKKFNFPYLYDGATQAMTIAYGPATTPHVFIFDKDRKLRFQGRIDDVEKPGKTPMNFDTRKAIDELLDGKEVTVKTTKVFGCSIKWSDKKASVMQGFADWAKEPVALDIIDEAGVKELVKNNSGKLRLINVWATWCGPCLIELPEFVTINRMYRERDFELITICLDDTTKMGKALKLLQARQMSNRNYLFDLDKKFTLIEAVDPGWQGALPYTLLIEPGGKIVYQKQNVIDPKKLKEMIVDNKMIGRFYK
jgi:thiol-disulfide isomerase/thioredoxin